MNTCDMTSRLILAGILSLSLLSPARAEEAKEEADPAAEPAPAESPSFVLVRMTDYEGLTTFMSATPEEFSELAKAARKDNAVLNTAYNNLRTEWKKTKSKVERRTVKVGGVTQQFEEKIPAPPFPIAKCPAPREVKRAGLYATAEELEKAKVILEENEKNRRERGTSEKATREAGAESGFIPMGGRDMGGLARAVPFGTSKATTPKPARKHKPTSNVSEEDMIKNLVKEIEKLTRVKETEGGGFEGLGGADLSKGIPEAGLTGLSGAELPGTGHRATNPKAGGSGKKTSASKAVRRIGE